MFAAYRIGAHRLINRKSREVKSRVAKGRGMVAITRQLAEAHRSPVPAIKNQDARALGNKLRESARRASRIAQLEISHDLAGFGEVSVGHGFLMPAERPGLIRLAARYKESWPE